MIIDKALSKIFGTKHDRDMKALTPLVEEVGRLEPELVALPLDGLRSRLGEIRERVESELKDLPSDLEARRAKTRSVLDPFLPRVFALVREAGKRTIGQRHYDVQLRGGAVLHQGKISEMRTGEGKTLVATLPVTLNAIAGRGAHVVTVNDYLARRDAEWMGRIYTALGLTVGCIQHDLDDAARREAYACDITYGTNNEFGFDYLRDNMKFELTQMVQRPHFFALVDEVDSILIDEARTPLIISGPSEGDVDIYYRCDRIVPKLVRGEEIKDKYGNKTTTGDFLVDEKAHTAALTEEGVGKCERLLGVENLYDPTNIDVLHACQQALRAHALYKRDVNYVVKDGQVIIVDEFTGRLMPGRRWSDGLHQAVEAKEGVKIERENQTLATVTLQNYFRMYDKLAGMTGTADTEAAEFDKIYKLDVVVVPTNRDMVRQDGHDVVYRTEREKFDAVVEEIVELHEKKQPVLVGTISIEKSEHLGQLLKKRGVPHVVLNAKYHEQEATIVAQAGQPGRVTIATNMAGRGTDILLGGNPEFLAKQRCKGKSVEEYEALLEEAKAECAAAHEEVIAAGGLHIIGTERHESRRIDNQLRGRAGRQGDPGSSRFYLSLEDDLMRIFGSDRLSGLMKRLGMEEGVPIEHRWVTKSIERAQKQVEARNFDTRKHLLEYDDVMNKQREEIYRLRKEILTGALSHEYVVALAEDVAEDYVDRHCPAGKDHSEWDWKALSSVLGDSFGTSPEEAGLAQDSDNNAALKDKLKAYLRTYYEQKTARLGADVMKDFEKFFMLQTVDALWKDHLLALDHLKEGIGLRGYGQRDPLVEYKKESFQLFEAMKEAIEEQILQNLFRFEVVRPEEAEARWAPSAPAASAAPAAPEDVAAPSGGVSAPALSTRASAELERRAQRQRREMSFQGTSDPTSGGDFRVDTVKSAGPKVGRNDPCPCGSGKKYKKCHGASSAA
ncbi:MAG: preprotein translocase subunit SecA [Thermoanaerobaculia bacterium]|jgi:preprotein translocase subunit SecA|nr:preprotein translocase subunit SecA [Thermoanaerobaculia bacterium]